MDTSELPRQGANLSANRVDFSSSVTPASLPVSTLRLPSCLGAGVKVSTKQHEQTSTRLPVVRVRRKRGGKRREQKSVKRFVEKKNGSKRSGLGRGQHQQLRSRSANIEKCSGRSAQHRKSGHCLLCVNTKKSLSFAKRLRQKRE